MDKANKSAASLTASLMNSSGQRKESEDVTPGRGETLTQPTFPWNPQMTAERQRRARRQTRRQEPTRHSRDYRVESAELLLPMSSDAVMFV